MHHFQMRTNYFINIWSSLVNFFQKVHLSKWIVPWTSVLCVLNELFWFCSCFPPSLSMSLSLSLSLNPELHYNWACIHFNWKQFEYECKGTIFVKLFQCLQFRLQLFTHSPRIAISNEALIDSYFQVQTVFTYGQFAQLLYYYL